MSSTTTKQVITGGILAVSLGLSAQSVSWYSSTDNQFWQEGKAQLQDTAGDGFSMSITGQEKGHPFRAWGSCMNELDWDAIQMLPEDAREDLFRRMYAPDGELKFNAGRIAIGASDYGRSWYSCDEVSGDFTLKYFNIDRDRTSVIPYIKAAQKYNPDLIFWASPWSPPSWMKVNHYYSVRSDRRYNEMDPKSEIHLFGEQFVPEDQRFFPPRLAVNDTFIQDPRYLKAYAQYFCKFIEAYQAEGIPVKRIFYQNEAYSYTNYPGCAWTPEGTIRFNMDYLAPALKEKHPDVELYMGTFNTNRMEIFEKILADPRMADNIKGIGLQWEAAQLLSKLREKYPNYDYIGTESECGSGTFDWNAGEHTFFLMNHYIGGGCTEYFIWNGVLADSGASAWGWRQNALVQVNSEKHTARYTPEYYAVMHYSHFLTKGSKILAYHKDGPERLPILFALDPNGKMVVIAGNFNSVDTPISLKLGEKFLNVKLRAHSFNTFVVK